MMICSCCSGEFMCRECQEDVRQEYFRRILAGEPVTSCEEQEHRRRKVQDTGVTLPSSAVWH